MLDVSGGTVLVDGVDVRLWDLQALRRRIGMATQRVPLYSDTVSSNIAYSAPDDISEDDVALYARLAAADFICSLPEGFDTIIGEQGTGLSGGQKQRIALARALAKQPEILILDDTTSAVDLEAARKAAAQKSSGASLSLYKDHCCAAHFRCAQRGPDTRIAGRAHRAARHP